MNAPLLWDQHCCLPLTPAADVGDLLRFREVGASFVSANVGYAPTDAGAHVQLPQRGGIGVHGR